MFKRVSPYIGEYRKYTVWATILMSLGIIANIAIPLIIIVLMFVFDWRLGLLSLVPLVVGMFAMSMMMKSGIQGEFCH